MFNFSWFFIFIVVLIVLAIGSSIIQNNFKNKNKQFSSVRNSANKTGAQIAFEILERNGVKGVKIYQGKEGQDHFDPVANKIVLSPSVYSSASVTAAAIASHEVGHAIQWAREEKKIIFRDKVHPVVNTVNKFTQILIMICFLLVIFSAPWNSYTWWNLMLVGIVIAYSAMAFFYLITLPVEFDASRKAMKELKYGKYISEDQYVDAKSLLKSASYTYLYAFFATLIMLLLWIIRLKARSGR